MNHDAQLGQSHSEVAFELSWFGEIFLSFQILAIKIVFKS